MSDNNQLTGIGFGLAGGLMGTVLMDIVMIITFVFAGQPVDTFFNLVGEKLGDGAMLGIAVHNVIGTTGGFVFALLVLNINLLRLTDIKKGLKLGVAAGAITIPLGCIPMAIWLGEPIVGVVAFSLLPHLVWGTFVGWAVAWGLLRKGI